MINFALLKDIKAKFMANLALLKDIKAKTKVNLALLKDIKAKIKNIKPQIKAYLDLANDIKA